MSRGDCIECCFAIRPRQEALQCKNCTFWQHRTCNTGITRDDFKLKYKGTNPHDWTCVTCDGDVSGSFTSYYTEPNNVPEDNVPWTNESAAAAFHGNVEELQHQVSLMSLMARQSPLHQVDDFSEFIAINDDLSESDRSVSDIENNDGLDEIIANGRGELPAFAIPKPIQEPCLPSNETPEVSEDLTFKIITESSGKSKDKLTDNQGYSYTVNKKQNSSVYWRCTLRSCPATVTQKGTSFTMGKKYHNHNGVQGVDKDLEVRKYVKQKAVKYVFKDSGAIVDNAIMKLVGEENCPALTNPKNLQRMLNRKRETLRPKEPCTLDFELVRMDHFEDFLQKDIVTRSGRRHFVFSTPQQIDLLSRCKTWYLDGTFKIVRLPFTQLWSVHGFVNNDGQSNTKQVVLLYVLMSGKTESDYVHVLKVIKNILPSVSPGPECCVLDFERALWKAIGKVFPDSMIRGCAFHWTQAVWRKIQESGLQPAYMNDDAVFQYCRQVLALPFLPHEHIIPTFGKLCSEKPSPDLNVLNIYVERNWIKSKTWPPQNWSIFGQEVRTNNDVEGWHRRLNSRAKKTSIPFYMLSQLLFDESIMVSAQCNLVNNGRLERERRPHVREQEQKIFDSWQSYIDGEFDSLSLLLECAGVYAPSIAELS